MAGAAVSRLAAATGEAALAYRKVKLQNNLWYGATSFRVPRPTTPDCVV